MSIPWRKIRDNIATRFNKYVVMCSGGADSMFLLDFMMTLNMNNFVVVHFNHGIRKDNANRDMNFVKQFCHDNGLELYIGSGDVELINSARSVEQECRRQRYNYAKHIMHTVGADRLITGHHFGDQVETVIMKLCRGSSWDNLHMLEDNGFIFRPLLMVKKETIYDRCHARKIPYVEDETNQETHYLRNWVRNELIPMMNTRLSTNTIGKTALRVNQKIREKELVTTDDEG